MTMQTRGDIGRNLYSIWCILYLELDEAAEQAPHIRGGDLHYVDGHGGQHKAQAHSIQEPYR